MEATSETEDPGLKPKLVELSRPVMNETALKAVCEIADIELKTHMIRLQNARCIEVVKTTTDCHKVGNRDPTTLYNYGTDCVGPM
ncbi:uncharacterized protein N7483_010052 [Penicillium malachiteum]|uniref:uncharacterized protein n=1 Tax=Penicillium malachiteum TaxID=1324776 RepID=UPI0025497E68|nr:uncharacterized protein N7483_010052 [Penicillium malachiteum]KAJ5712871.1 hypothetical protein N7483_010052 [Penicillium malachiteum]